LSISNRGNPPEYSSNRDFENAGGGLGRPCRPSRCGADHIHNLPALLKNYSPEGLKFYWEIERAGFISKATEITAFEELWKKLHAFAASTGQPVLVP